ncbi:MAG TPA: flagellar protein FlaG [Syntrophorhabdales bacterium]|nr:flagellar protein FlaG [Syntrophorhabdales bacterium]
MKTTPTAEAITAQFQVVDYLTKRGAVPQQDVKQPVTTAADAAPAKVDPEDVKQAAQEINQVIKSLNDHLQFSVDDTTKNVVVKLIDGDTGKVLRQIPPEEVLKLREYYKEHEGLLVNTAV